MKRFIVLLFGALLALPGLAADPVCNQAFGNDVAMCAQSVKGLAPADRPGAQKACVINLQAARTACSNGSNQCLTTCQTNLTNQQSACYTNYNVAQCGGDPLCVSLITDLQNTCLTDAQVTYTSCTVGCQ